MSTTYHSNSTHTHTSTPLECTSLECHSSVSASELLEYRCIDLPRKSMRAIVMHFKHADTVVSEEYIFPKIKKVEISFDGDPNAVYSRGMRTNDLHREARRVFHVKDSDMTEERFYDNKFALVIDLRNNSDNSAMGSGCKVIDTKTGVQLAITKQATTKDVRCEIFVLSDEAVSTVGRSFGRLDFE